MFFEERVADLMRKMLRKKLYVVISKPVVPPEKLKPFLMAHLEYMIGLEQRGLVFASGPLADGEGPPSGQGLTVLRAKSAAEARALAEGRSVLHQRLAHFRVEGMDDHGGYARPLRQSFRSIDRGNMTIAGEVALT